MASISPYENIFNKKENIENIYNFLKSEDGKLKRDTVRKMIEDMEGVSVKLGK